MSSIARKFSPSGLHRIETRNKRRLLFPTFYGICARSHHRALVLVPACARAPACGVDHCEENHIVMASGELVVSYPNLPLLPLEFSRPSLAGNFPSHFRAFSLLSDNQIDCAKRRKIKNKLKTMPVQNRAVIPNANYCSFQREYQKSVESGVKRLNHKILNDKKKKHFIPE